MKIPDGNSVYGFITRRTPHRLHVTYKRKIRKKKLAGTPGHGTHPVVYDSVVSMSGLQRWAEDEGMETIDLFGDNSHTQFFGRMWPTPRSEVSRYSRSDTSRRATRTSWLSSANRSRRTESRWYLTERSVISNGDPLEASPTGQRRRLILSRLSLSGPFPTARWAHRRATDDQR